eukprot:2754248-Karenia_brevis.AAC.1
MPSDCDAELAMRFLELTASIAASPKSFLAFSRHTCDAQLLQRTVRKIPRCCSKVFGAFGKLTASAARLGAVVTPASLR